MVNNLFFTASSEVDKIYSSIKKVKITIFTYIKNFNDHVQIHFYNLRLWIEDYYKLELYKNSLFENHSNRYETIVFLWANNIHNPKVIKHEKPYFNSHNGIIPIEKQLGGCEFYSFFVCDHNRLLINFYINNLSILKKLHFNFKNIFNKTLKKAGQSKVIIPKNKKV